VENLAERLVDRPAPGRVIGWGRVQPPPPAPARSPATRRAP
jgi:hypothetical protein